MSCPWKRTFFFYNCSCAHAQQCHWETGWEQPPQLTKLHQEILKKKTPSVKKEDMDSRPFFIYFNTRQKVWDRQTPHHQAQIPSWTRSRQDKGSQPPFPQVAPWGLVCSPLAAGHGAPTPQGRAGRWHLTRKILKPAREDERDVDLIKPLPLSWVSQGLGWMLKTTQHIWKRTKFKIT